MAAFRRAVAAAPNFLEPRLQLAHLLRRTGSPGAALPEYAHVLEVDPRVADARFGRAMASVALKRYADARAELEEGRRLHPERVGFALALIRLMAAAPDERVRDGAKGVSIADSIPPPERRIEWAIVRAMALAEAGRFDEAIALQRAAITTLERNGSADLAKTQTGVLRLYESRRPSRTPWQPDEPMELPS
jgi:tetratricopeptide (TPR) repeat protein